MNTKTDLFFIILFIIVVSIIIGLNIIKLIDKKISSVSVNIPRPTIVLNVDKKLNGQISLCVDEKKTDSEPSIVVNNDKKIEPKLNDNINKNSQIEKFIVADANEFARYKELREKILKKSGTFEVEDIDNPIAEDIVDYDADQKAKDRDFTIQMRYPDHEIGAKPKHYIPARDTKAYISAADFGLEAPRQVVGCANSSIAQKWRSGKTSLLPHQISCDKPNKITAENYYKTVYKAQVIPIEDSRVRGYNYMDFSNTVAPGKSDIRILSQSTKGLNPDELKIKYIPDGFNYGFHNSPAMSMP